MLRRSVRHVRILALMGILAAVAAATLGPVAAPARAAGDDPVRVRVATYNIHHGAGPDDVLDLEHVARVLASTRAEVIGLQEVDNHWGARSNFVDQANWLAKKLDMHVAYGANLDLDPLEPGQERRQYGTAILSRFPIKSWSNTYLPKFGNHEQRGLLVTNLNVRGIPVRFANTHLQHNDNLERQAQAAKIVELLGSTPSRTIVVGDLNATPDAPEIKTLTDVFTDTWTAGGVGDGFTYSVEHPDRRIDFVLASRDLGIRKAEVVSADASDHLPVVVDLTVRR
ncbi:endonuclease/exonuclease/phosphatase family protein [Actinopolymorpha alba]|uniref:endonuclease/exonuclease/phosphatase family protein n=1 Tax=Actinopolymorpha alba TaxID=533267 RepID=UPI0003AB3499|nr:endonuclease/exonuclease/phosphatase family protein [Actinopolymorpha alba]